MSAPAPTPAEAAVIDRFGIFAEERAIEEVARALYDNTTQHSEWDLMKEWAVGWDETTDYNHRLFRRLAVAAVATYRATQDGAR